jgi:hypothetical protein
MDAFLGRHTSSVKGTLSGFDRVRFRETLRWLANVGGMGAWYRSTVLLKDFAEYAVGLTEQIKQSTTALAKHAGQPLPYLASSSLRKEDFARTRKSCGFRYGLLRGRKTMSYVARVEPSLNSTPRGENGIRSACVACS